MYPAEFEYERPADLAAALDLLARHGQDAKVLAGGASLVPLMKLRLARPALVIDIGRLPGLAGFERRDGQLVIRALTRHADVELADDLRTTLPILHDVASRIGDPQIRNMGTVGGGVAECDPAGDWGPALLALGASLRCVSRRGERVVPADDFFVDAYTPALAPDEILTEILVPLPPRGSGGAHVKLERRSGDFAVANVSVQLTLDGAGRYERIGIGVGAIGLKPVRAARAEAVLRGERPSEARLAEAAREVAACTEAVSDVRGSAEYRRHVAAVLFRRAVALAERRARGGGGEGRHG
ncbi:MAG TPA: xanthine dehydrogenase family protein subunit M [Thermodesulfobacteriota bacterium]|nr:xanthine dehydrogenase family protein subunit M [Thermodesulfobacteriota bacterium]